MNPTAILWPVGALAMLTFVVLMLVPFRRFRAAFARQVRAGDFRYGESPNVPGEVAIPNRNYMNLLESPNLFYDARDVEEVRALQQVHVVAIGDGDLARDVGRLAVAEITGAHLAREGRAEAPERHEHEDDEGQHGERADGPEDRGGVHGRSSITGKIPA